jgi:hypothetical protein
MSHEQLIPLSTVKLIEKGQCEGGGGTFIADFRRFRIFLLFLLIEKVVELLRRCSGLQS